MRTVLDVLELRRNVRAKFVCEAPINNDIERVLRARGDPAGATLWFPTESLYHHRYDVRDWSVVIGVGAEATNSTTCFIDLTKAYDFVDDRTQLSRGLAHFGVGITKYYLWNGPFKGARSRLSCSKSSSRRLST